jgi:hypothetical protein
MYEVVRHVDVHPPEIVRGVSPYIDEPYISSSIAPHVSRHHIVGAAPGYSKGAGAFALSLELTLDEVEPAIRVLDERLRSTGMRINYARNGISIVPKARLDAGSGGDRERERHLTCITNADMVLVHRLLTEEIHQRAISLTNNGNVSLHRVTDAGLVEVINGRLTLKESVHASLFT